MFSLGSRKRRPKGLHYIDDSPAARWKILPTADPMEHHPTYIAIPECDLPALVKRYAKAMETEESQDWCTCQWIIHPDDVNVKAGNCRECYQSKKAGAHSGLPEDFEYGKAHLFKGKRMRLGDQSPDCPAHTKEGLLLYFFRWVFKS